MYIFLLIRVIRVDDYELLLLVKVKLESFYCPMGIRAGHDFLHGTSMRIQINEQHSFH